MFPLLHDLLKCLDLKLLKLSELRAAHRALTSTLSYSALEGITLREVGSQASRLVSPTIYTEMSVFSFLFTTWGMRWKSSLRAND